MKTMNGWIAVTPFPQVSLKTTHARGMAMIDQTQKLTVLTVLCDSYSADGKHYYQPGNKVFLKGDAMKHQWAGEVLEMDDDAKTKFILIPHSIVVAASET